MKGYQYYTIKKSLKIIEILYKSTEFFFSQVKTSKYHRGARIQSIFNILSLAFPGFPSILR